MSLRPRPSIRELPGDLLTPVGAYLRIRDLGPGFLLESIERGQQVGRYSFLGAGCEVVTLDHGAADPFAPLREFLARHAGRRRERPAAVRGRRRRAPRLRRHPPVRADRAAAGAASGRRAGAVAVPARRPSSSRSTTSASACR